MKPPEKSRKVSSPSIIGEPAELLLWGAAPEDIDWIGCRCHIGEPSQTTPPYQRAAPLKQARRISDALSSIAASSI
jgi:hypothetical protein